MATAPNYKNGPILTLQAASGEQLETGGELLKNNFEALYDMVRPTEYQSGKLLDVPTTYQTTTSGEVIYHKASTFALPRGYNFPGSGYYVAVFDSSTNTVSWKPYTSGTIGDGVGNVSELVNTNLSAHNAYWDGSSWIGSGPAPLNGFQKTYKTVVHASDGRFPVTLPAFGSFLITGTIMFIQDTPSGNLSYGHLYRINWFGAFGQILARVNEVCVNGEWSHASIVCPDRTPNGGQVAIYDSGGANMNNILADLTVLGGSITYGGTSGLNLGSSPYSA